MGLAEALHLTRDYERELVIAKAAIERANQDIHRAHVPLLHSLEMAALAALGRVEEIRAFFPQSEPPHDEEADPLTFAGTWLMHYGYRDAGLDLLSRADRLVDAQRARGDSAFYWNEKAYLSYYKRDFAATDSFVSRALAFTPPSQVPGRF